MSTNDILRKTISISEETHAELVKIGVYGAFDRHDYQKMCRCIQKRKRNQEVTSEKKKKKVLVQSQPELIGSADYIASHEIDQIIKKGRDRIKHAITVSDEKLTKTKKQIVREMAVQLEQAGYPINEICDRLSKSLKGLVNDRTVRDALESKYKDQSQSQVGHYKTMTAAVFTANRNNSEKRP